MSQVILDGQLLSLPKSIPEDPSAVLNSMVNTLEDSGRCLTAFQVDGVDWINGADLFAVSSLPFHKVEARSIPLEDMMLRLIAQARASTLGFRDLLERYNSRLAEEPWDSLVADCGLVAQQFIPLAHVLGVLSHHRYFKKAPWQSSRLDFLKQLESHLNFYASAAEGRDSRALALCVQSSLIPWLDACWLWVDGPLLTAFKQKHSYHQALRN